MIRRPHGRKPTLALWMLVALADLVILTAATGLVIPVATVLVGGIVAARVLARRAGNTAETVVRHRA